MNVLERSIWFPLCRMWNRIRGTIDEIKWFFQRGRRGYADCDIWNFSDYLVDILIPVLTWLRDNYHCCPPNLWDDNAEDQSHEWKKILTEMVEGFESYKEIVDYTNNLDIKTQKVLEKKFRKSMKLLNKWFFYLND